MDTIEEWEEFLAKEGMPAELYRIPGSSIENMQEAGFQFPGPHKDTSAGIILDGILDPVLERLRPHEKKALTLRYFRGLGERPAAQRMGLTRHKYRVLHERSLRRFVIELRREAGKPHNLLSEAPNTPVSALYFCG